MKFRIIGLFYSDASIYLEDLTTKTILIWKQPNRARLLQYAVGDVIQDPRTEVMYA
jgi:hypothetical protein